MLVGAAFDLDQCSGLWVAQLVTWQNQQAMSGCSKYDYLFVSMLLCAVPAAFDLRAHVAVLDMWVLYGYLASFCFFVANAHAAVCAW